MELRVSFIINAFIYEYEKEQMITFVMTFSFLADAIRILKEIIYR